MEASIAALQSVSSLTCCATRSTRPLKAVDGALSACPAALAPGADNGAVVRRLGATGLLMVESANGGREPRGFRFRSQTATAIAAIVCNAARGAFLK